MKNDPLFELKELTEKMLKLANRGQEESKTDASNILFGILRDDAYKLRNLADLELSKLRGQLN
jgi:hypothetical protein